MNDRLDVTQLYLSPHSNILCLCSPPRDVVDLLSNDESLAVQNAVEKRRHEFATGRWLAHTALKRIGIHVDSIPCGTRREPIWPGSVIGSITHTHGLVAVAVSKDPALVGLGIDLEEIGRADESVIGEILTDWERSSLGNLDPTLLFSAKEASYKLLYPTVREYVDFQAVEVRLQESDRTFRLKYVGDHPGHAFIEGARGSYQQVAGHWLTSVVFDASSQGYLRPPARTSSSISPKASGCKCNQLP